MTKTSFKWIKVIALVCFILLPVLIFAQKDSVQQKQKIKNIAWFTPNGVNKINGLAVGIQAMNLKDEKLVINGFNADAGMGSMLALPYLMGNSLASKKNKIDGFLEVDTANTFVNGLSISAGGEFVISVNGVNIAGGITSAADLNGLSVTGIYTKCNSFKGVCITGLKNIAKKGAGLQIGIFNYCKNLKGLQIGLWNKSGKRGLPFINWGT